MHHSATNKYPKWNVSSKCFNCLPDAQQSLVDPNKDDVPRNPGTCTLTLSALWVKHEKTCLRSQSIAAQSLHSSANALAPRYPSAQRYHSVEELHIQFRVWCSIFCRYCSRKSYERLCLNSHFKVEELILRWKNSVREILLVFGSKKLTDMSSPPRKIKLPNQQERLATSAAFVGFHFVAWKGHVRLVKNLWRLWIPKMTCPKAWIFWWHPQWNSHIRNEESQRGFLSRLIRGTSQVAPQNAQVLSYSRQLRQRHGKADRFALLEVCSDDKRFKQVCVLWQIAPQQNWGVIDVKPLFYKAMMSSRQEEFQCKKSSCKKNSMHSRSCNECLELSFLHHACWGIPSKEAPGHIRGKEATFSLDNIASVFVLPHLYVKFRKYSQKRKNSISKKHQL